MAAREPHENRARTTRLCQGLFERWDPMFSKTVDPTRMRRMDAILKALKKRSRGRIKVLDLGSGPGTLTERVLRRFPKSRVVAVDTDPVLLQVGADALHRFGKRADWVLADLRRKSWASALPIRRFDAAVSSLALHWLEEKEIRALYQDLRTLLRPGGQVINGDFLPSSSTRSPRRPTERRRGAGRSRTNQRAFRSGWEKWWDAVEKEPSMRPVLRERQMRLPGEIPPRRTSGPKIPVSLEGHERALRDAGFRDTTVSWEDGGFHVLIGVR